MVLASFYLESHIVVVFMRSTSAHLPIYSSAQARLAVLSLDSLLLKSHLLGAGATFGLAQNALQILQTARATGVCPVRLICEALLHNRCFVLYAGYAGPTWTSGTGIWGASSPVGLAL